MLIVKNTNKLSDKKLRKYLYDFNFDVYSNGTVYLIDAIQIAYNKPHLLKTMKDIYSIISTKYSVSENTVKWSIRNSIETMNRNTSTKDLKIKLHAPYYRKITPKCFIPLVISHFDK